MGRYWVNRFLQNAVLGVVACAVVASFALAGGDEPRTAEVDWQAKLAAKIEQLRAEGQPVTIEEALARRTKLPESENSAVALL
jgi:hypothetical protein